MNFEQLVRDSMQRHIQHDEYLEKASWAERALHWLNRRNCAVCDMKSRGIRLVKKESSS